MSGTEQPEWVTQTLQKYVGKKAGGIKLPELGRNMQPEIVRLQAVIDTVTKYKVPDGEIVRLRNKAQDLLNILNAKQ